MDIPPAKLVSCKSHAVPGQLRISELFFEVPLDYANPSAGTITLFARRARKRERPIFRPDHDDQGDDGHGDGHDDDDDGGGDDETDDDVGSGKTKPAHHKPYMVYLEGGPGFGNREPQEHPLTRAVLARGYQLLYLDHRGVGLSTPVSTEMLARFGDADAQARYLRLMRQDNTVRDCEAVRKCLTAGWPPRKAAWSLFGQSYGGFVSLSYLSMYPRGLREVFLTGGLAPVTQPIDDVYRATFARTAHRNSQYFAKFPGDVDVLAQLAAYLAAQGGAVPLPAGGFLTMPRLLTSGIAFGGHGGFDSVHNLLLHLKTSLDQLGFFSRAALHAAEVFTTFDNNIIYAILHEAIYCDGPGHASAWSAYRVGRALEPFSWLNPGADCSEPSRQLYFSGEMIFPLHFETYPELIPLRDVAERLAAADDWTPLYDEQQLRNNTVPVYAMSYVEDMYVDYDFARHTARLVKGTRVAETNTMYHSALRAKSDDVLQALFNLRDDVLD